MSKNKAPCCGGIVGALVEFTIGTGIGVGGAMLIKKFGPKIKLVNGYRRGIAMGAIGSTLPFAGAAVGVPVMGVAAGSAIGGMGVMETTVEHMVRSDAKKAIEAAKSQQVPQVQPTADSSQTALPVSGDAQVYEFAGDPVDGADGNRYYILAGDETQTLLDEYYNPVAVNGPEEQTFTIGPDGKVYALGGDDEEPEEVHGDDEFRSEAELHGEEPEYAVV